MTVDGSRRLLVWEQEFLDRQVLEGESRWSIRCFKQTTSTMDEARALVDSVEPEHPMMIIAREQSAGRGRQGRKWEASERSFLATAILVAKTDLSRLAGYSLAVGVSAATVLEGFGFKAKLKWPNDLLNNDLKKVGGVLIESELRADGSVAILVGIGINLAKAPIAVPDAAAIDSGVIGVVEFAQAFAAQLWRDWQGFLDFGFLRFKEDWLNVAAYLGESLTIDLGAAPERKLVTGICEGVNDSGALLLRVGEDLIPIVAGHVVAKGDGGVR
jgi:BirA family biotin operon repressor/biotin-[acetyl-CoA-carboxylase] ligase